MPRKEHFGEQFGFSREEQAKAESEAYGAHLLNVGAQAGGYHDYEHQQLEKKRVEEERFAETYRDRNIDHYKGRHPYGGEVVPDTTYDGSMYRIKHPSGWIAEHRGMLTTIVHPKHGVVDLIDYNNYGRHGLGSPATPDDWPSPHQVHAEVNDWVQNYAQDYE